MKSQETLLSDCQQLVQQHLRRQKTVAEAIIRAQQEERARIGHELHDNINQILTSVHLYISVLKKDNPEFDELREKAIDILTLGIEEIRKLSRDMVMHDFGEEGLVGSIRNLVNEINFSRTIKMQLVHSDLSQIETLDANIKISIFRIVQEQTKNILKHSKANTAWIYLHRCDDQFRLQIRDDGIGFDPATTRCGLGFSNIYERTGLYQGKVILNAFPGRGCSLIVNIPLTQQILS